jgi:hypothetical protein
MSMYLLTCLDCPFLSFEAQISEIRKVWDHPIPERPCGRFSTAENSSHLYHDRAVDEG